MDQIKIGEFITKLRKEKGLTQDQLGEKLGITGKSVSKWERGLHLPDLNNLIPLADILGTNVNELLNGGIDIDVEQNADAIVVDNIKAYSNKYKKKFLFMLLIFLIMVILLIISIFFYNNYNKNKIYYFYGSNDNYTATGYYILNPERNILIVRNIEYINKEIKTIKEPKIVNINIAILLDDVVLGTYNDDMLEQEEYYDISDVLKNISIVIDDDNIEDVSVNDSTNIKMIVEYIDTNESFNRQEIIFKLDKLFSSNKIIYK